MTKESRPILYNHARPRNAILAALPENEYQRVFSKLKSVSLPLGRVLYKSGGLIEDVYFPESGLVSLVTHMKEKVTIEVGVIGNDGMVGIPVLLGDDIAFEEAIVQMAGNGMQMKSSDLKQEVKSSHSSLLTILLLYTRTLMKQVGQTAACNSLHTIEKRLSRWMLMCRDRMESDELPLTQEFISNMLGTRRSGVSIAASLLQKRGLIRYSRGHITVLDRQGLEDFACGCYRAVKGEIRDERPVVREVA
jgi:CRP-like cAMP-binding protein